jgi:acyl-CoA hydrolase
MKAEMTEIVMPGDTNHMGTCFGGTIMSWIDKIAAVAAQRMVGSVVTASVDSIQFRQPIRVGDVVTLKASVNRIWGTSMEVGVKVLKQSPQRSVNATGTDKYQAYTELSGQVQACRAYLTFVAIDNEGQRRKVGQHDVELIVRKDSESEWRHRYYEANDRREVRLANRK